MACLHPIKRDIFDYRLQKMVTIEVPCGKCINCINAFSRGWEFRIRKTAESCKGGFIYDTLTVRDDAMLYLDYSEIKDDGIIVYPGFYFSDGVDRTRTISNRVLSLLEHYDFKIPYFHKFLVSHWIKKARERYRKATGKRLKLRYAIVQEYGPKYSRPHFHCMFFGISYEDYITYFALPWRAQYGFTKTKWISDKKDIGCVSSYLTKYFCKGDFESPLVKCGLLPKPFRMLSHGIGIEYLKDSRCNFSSYLSLPPALVRLALDTSVDSADLVLVQNLCSMIDLALADLSSDDLFYLMDKVRTAYLGSYPLSLPRYYKDKLFNANKKSCFYEILTHHIRDFSNKSRYLQLCEFVALKLGLSVKEIDSNFKDNSLSYPYWLSQFTSFQREQARIKSCDTRKVFKNIFTRYLVASKSDALCQ